MSDQKTDPAVPATTLREQFQKELERIEATPGSHVDLTVDRAGASAEIEVEKSHWSVSAWAKYYWDQSWAAAARVRAKW